MYTVYSTHTDGMVVVVDERREEAKPFRVG